MYRYLELLNRTAPMLEDLYLCMAEALDLD